MVNDLIKLIEKLAELFNIPKWLANGVTVYILFLCIVFFLLKFITKKLILLRNQALLNKDLAPFFTRSDIERATRYYIPTKYQNISPSEDDEPGRKYIASAKNPLIPLFLSRVFRFAETDNKFYLLLADSGMGKTTFLINLYINYKNQFNSFLSKPKYNIKLYPLGFPKILNEIKFLDNQENTILLLDAFDEDTNAEGRHKERMGEILEATNKFRAIVITCRTQFFPTRHEEPHETGFFSYGESGEYKFQKLYISIFDDKDINKYLKLRFAGIHFYHRRQAKKIVSKIPNLVVRPMLLSHIEDLVNNNSTINYSFEVYEQLISKWIIRESNKPAIIKKYKTADEYGNLLYEFSKKLAIQLYQNRKIKGGFFITKEDNFGEKLNPVLADIDSAMLSETERRSRSLLNRDSEGKYKFSHKSIMEYFLAVELFSNTNFIKNFEFDGMDAAFLFVKEMFIKDMKNNQAPFSNYITSKRKTYNHLDLIDLEWATSISIELNLKQNVLILKIFQHLDSINFSCRKLTIFMELVDTISLFLSVISYEFSFFVNDPHNNIKKLKRDLNTLSNHRAITNLLSTINQLQSLKFDSLVTVLHYYLFEVSREFQTVISQLDKMLHSSGDKIDLPISISKLASIFIPKYGNAFIYTSPWKVQENKITITSLKTLASTKHAWFSQFDQLLDHLPDWETINNLFRDCLELQQKYKVEFH